MPVGTPRLTLFVAALLALLLPSGAAHAQLSLKLGVLTDMSGVYSDLTGAGAVAAVRMAVADCQRGPCAGMTIEVVSADHQNKPDVGSTIARQWMDRDGVDVLVDMSHAALQLAIPPIVAEKNRFAIFAGGTARLTGDACQPQHVVQWMWDTYVQVSALATRLTQPGTRWQLITADYALGAQLEADAKALVTARGGVYLGSVRHPFPSTDLSSFVVTAQSSGADVIALANAGGDTINAIKTAHEFGLPSATQKLAPFFLTANDVHSLGLAVAGGTINTEGFWWALDDGTRAFTDRFRAVTGGKMPSSIQAGLYSATLHYLRSAAAAGSKDPAAVLAKMRALPIEDDVVRHARLREDGRLLHDFYVFQIKTPAESTGEWDLYKLLATIPGEEAFRPIRPDLCKKLGG
jgi:branched-chain amino acid transport system substrate-binding protein